MSESASGYNAKENEKICENLRCINIMLYLCN